MIGRFQPLPDAVEFCPAGTAYMPRTSLQITRLLGYSDFNIEAVSTLLLGICGTQPALRHASGVTPEILAFLTRAGLVIEEDTRIYRTADEAARAARTLYDEGYKLVAPYPLATDVVPPEAALVPPELWYWLNAKKNLGALVDSAHLAPQEPVTAAATLTPPVFLKAGGEAVTGWGYAVRYCETAEDISAAMTWFDSIGATDDLVAEAAMDVVSCWCAHVVCSDDDTRYFGAAEQVFSGPGKQSGSVIDPANPLPMAGAEIVRRAGERARKLGYRGIAAMDIGQTRSGELVVFDPNFRVNACTHQILLYDQATRGTARPVSRSVNAVSPLPMTEIIARLDDPVASGWFVPTRLLDAALLDAAKGASAYTGFVLGADRQEAEARATALAALLSGDR